MEENERMCSFLLKIQNSTGVMVILIYFSLLVDNMLLTLIVPIIPDYIYQLENIINVNETNNHLWIYNITENSTVYNYTNYRSYDDLLRKNINKENGLVGILLASKALTQLVFNPLIGAIINRMGYIYPLVTGTIILIISCILFASSETFFLLLMARSIHGLGSSCISISEKKNSQNWLTKFWATLCIYIIVIVNNNNIIIIVVVGAICISTSAMSILEPCLPIWLIEVMSPPKWQLGLVFIPDSLGYLIGTNFFGPISFKFGRWLTAMLSLFLVGACATTIPFAVHVTHLLLPHFGIGLGIGVADAALMPLLASLVDKRHVSVYGSVYALAQVAVSLAYSLGPLVGSQLVNLMGFPTLMRFIGLLNILYSPLCCLIKDSSSPVQENKMMLIGSAAVPNYRAFLEENQYKRFIDDVD
ncbi:synaptic vesicular amine transporter-like [Centruroides sculpturatus]|uniref:synaptic vesicular amine transporter-like n=1 Tax=Centruroides sculpturatus TaxID=218467 RepID=UPI000C6E6379|nr:synaptic vesicular amine transporter-like [Centruroides sculpturatus]